jgi:hypothetical protein
MEASTEIFGLSDALERVLVEQRACAWDAITALTSLTAKALAVTIRTETEYQNALAATQQALEEMGAAWRK